MAASEQQETERKYDAPPDVPVPDLSMLSGVATMAEPVEVDQVATYYDTADLRLLAARVTLRSRTGGVDDGWHLKLPGAGHTRHEVRLPPGHSATPPEELLDRVRVHLRDEGVAPRAVVRTRRTFHRLLDDEGNVLAELCDDRVTAEVHGAAADVDEWREWELELVEGTDSLLDDAEPLLLAAGGSPSTSASKAARVLGEALPAGPSWRDGVELGEDPTTGDLLRAYLVKHLGRLEEQDRLLRSGDQEGVHQLRIAARRMRSALATYAPVLEPGSTEALRDELRWLGRTLSGARDAQVLQTRLDDLVDQQPVELVMGPVRQRIDDELRHAFRTGRAHADEQLNGERYFRLLDRLEAFVTELPVGGRAGDPARELVPDLLTRDRKRVLKRDRGHRRADGTQARDLALHDVRKAAKRLRYAAETARPVFGGRASKLASRAKRIQEVLGEHQDTVVARATLRGIGVRAHLSGENGFTFGRLHAVEECRAAELESEYPAVRHRLPSGKLLTWLEK